jgi:hypothetical protein
MNWIVECVGDGSFRKSLMEGTHAHSRKARDPSNSHSTDDPLTKVETFHYQGHVRDGTIDGWLLSREESRAGPEHCRRASPDRRIRAAASA